MSARRPGPMTRPKKSKKAKAALPAVLHPIVAGILERIDVQIAALLAVQQTILEIVQTINRKETQQLQKETEMSVELDDLTAQVTANTDGIASAITLINGIAGRIEAAGTDPVKLKALTTELRAKDDELAAAVAANTPSAPPA